MFYSVYSNVCVLKNLNILRCKHVLGLVLKCCSHIFEGKWILLLFDFLLLMNEAASLPGMNFFILLVKYIEVFSYCSVTETFAIGFQKWLTTKVKILQFSGCNKPRFVNFISAWTEICIICLSLIVFWRCQFFSIAFLRAFLVYSLNVPVLFCHRVSWYRSMSFSSSRHM